MSELLMNHYWQNSGHAQTFTTLPTLNYWLKLSLWRAWERIHGKLMSSGSKYFLATWGKRSYSMPPVSWQKFWTMMKMVVQVWLIIRFYSVSFLQSRISVQSDCKQIKVYVSCMYGVLVSLKIHKQLPRHCWGYLMAAVSAQKALMGSK